MTPPRVKWAMTAVVILIVLLTLIVWGINRILHTSASDSGGGDIIFTIAPGTNLSQVAARLETEGLIADRRLFAGAARLLRADRKIQPGRFLLPRGADNVEILRYLLRVGLQTKDVTIPEGLTVRQIASIFNRELGLDLAQFVALCEDSAFTQELGVKAGRLEGYLHPDTYNFYINSSEADVITRLTQQFFALLTDSLRSRIDSLGWSLHQALTLASIVQGEFKLENEAPLVSAVYHNRLRRRMPLGADPTIQYILPDGPRRLFLKDLDNDSPYNTYKNIGLPPGPVNNPGMTALIAALYPADVDYLYFVAVGNGAHTFNTNAEGHARDKAKFQKVRRKAESKKVRK
ncbi:MAG: endolytic transglycosylase MltG [Calditrichota bacterium]